MSQEIIYTSAPAGLKPGSRGFCTVAATRGMAKNLADHLEDLSGYRHLATGNDGRPGANPVAYSHFKTTVGGRAFHVLSRICDAGLDYTQRTNKLAHHVALDPQEVPPGGPAALLAAAGFMTTSWSGEPRVRESGPAVPRVESPPGVCHAWQRLTGDAGWGGVVATELAGDSRRPIVLIYRPGTDVLQLVVETLALLPAAKRRQATFSTYVTKLPPTIDCRWRCYVEGTPEAETAVRQAGALILDLRRQLGSSNESPYVEAARTGKPPRVAAAPDSALTASDDALIAALMEDDDVPPAKNVPTVRSSQPTQEAYGVGPPPVRSGLDARPRPHGPRPNPRSRITPAILTLVGVSLLLLVIGVGFAINYTIPDKSLESADRQTEDSSTTKSTQHVAEIRPSTQITTTNKSPEIQNGSESATPKTSPTSPVALKELPQTPPTVSPETAKNASVDPAILPQPTASATPQSPPPHAPPTQLESKPIATSVDLPEPGNDTIVYPYTICDKLLGDLVNLQLATSTTSISSGIFLLSYYDVEFKKLDIYSSKHDALRLDDADTFQKIASFWVEDSRLLYHRIPVLKSNLEAYRILTTSSICTVTPDGKPHDSIALNVGVKREGAQIKKVVLSGGKHEINSVPVLPKKADPRILDAHVVGLENAAITVVDFDTCILSIRNGEAELSYDISIRHDRDRNALTVAAELIVDKLPDPFRNQSPPIKTTTDVNTFAKKKHNEIEKDLKLLVDEQKNTKDENRKANLQSQIVEERKKLSDLDSLISLISKLMSGSDSRISFTYGIQAGLNFVTVVSAK